MTQQIRQLEDIPFSEIREAITNMCMSLNVLGVTTNYDLYTAVEKEYLKVQKLIKSKNRLLEKQQKEYERTTH